MIKKIIILFITIIVILLIYYYKEEIINNYILSLILMFGSMFLTIGLLFYIMIKSQIEIDKLNEK